MVCELEIVGCAYCSKLVIGDLLNLFIYKFASLNQQENHFNENILAVKQI
jgi:hypothetical protein